MEDVVNFVLDIDNWVDIVHDWDLKSLLAAIDENGKYEVVIRVKKSLIEKRRGVKKRQVGTIFDIYNYLQWQKKGIKIKEY